jgi:cell division protein FtsB
MFKKKKVRRSREFNKNNQMIDFEKAKETRKEKRETLMQMEEKEKPSKRERLRKVRKRNFYFVSVVVIVAIIGVSIFNVFSAREDLDAALASKEALERERARLEHRLENVESPEFIEYRARALLRMVRPGEIYFVLPNIDED